MTDTSFYHATLTGVDLSAATVRGADFADSTSSGFVKEQLYSTASYQAGDLCGISLRDNDLTGWNLAGQNLTNADFGYATLSSTDLSGATIVAATFDGTTGFTKEQLYATASYQGGKLCGISLSGLDLTGWSLADQDLTNVYLGNATLTSADLSGAIVVGADFGFTSSEGFTKEQLYSTASYQAGDLRGIGLGGDNLTGWNLADQNLSNAMLYESTLAGTDLRRADVRGALYLTAAQLSSAITNNLILPDGHIAGLDLGAGEALRVRDYAGGIAITVDDTLQLNAAATLELLFADTEWGSTISLADGFVADLDGTLRLDFARGTELASLVGTTFDLFHWNGGLLPGDTFDQVLWPTWAAWDISDLYIGGTATLTAVPEPGTAGLLLFGGLLLARRRWT